MTPPPTAQHPIEIVGGGLAGLSLGLALRREGVPVTLFEAADYPRHRVCGEFISGLSRATIGRLGLEDILQDALRHREVAWFIRGAPPRIQKLPSPALGISRHTLDERLARAFVAAGGVLQTQSRIPNNGIHPGRVYATGRRPVVRSRWIGLKLHLRGLALVRELELHLGDDCYVGFAQINDGVVNVCGLFRRRSLSLRGPDLLFAYLEAAGLTELRARLGVASVDAGSFCAVAAMEFDRRVHVDGSLRLGDASAMIPPFTGNGMAMAFQSAECALPGLLAYARGECSWNECGLVVNLALRRRFRLRLASAGALHSFLLQPRRQRWFGALSRARLVPFGPLYATLH